MLLQLEGVNRTLQELPAIPDRADTRIRFLSSPSGLWELLPEKPVASEGRLLGLQSLFEVLLVLPRRIS